jgi:fructose-specific phosphotransferase system IIA component
VLNESCVFFDIAAASQREAISYLVNKASELGRVTSVDKVVQAVLDRENESSTGFGNGIAIPHGKCASVNEPTLLFGKLQSGVEWNALDGAPVSILFMILVPEESHTEHLKILSKLARKLMHEDFIEKIKQTDDKVSLTKFVQAELA